MLTGGTQSTKKLIFEVDDLKCFKTTDLAENNISISNISCPLGSLSENGVVKKFQASLQKSRCLKFHVDSPNLKDANHLIETIQSRNIFTESQLNISNSDDNMPLQELENIREMRQYVSLMDDYLPRRKFKNPSESCLDAMFISKIIDPCFEFKTSLYQRNQNFPYPLNFACKNALCHTFPRLDVSFFNTWDSESILILGVESKIASGTRNPFFENDAIKLALIGRLMYEIIKCIDSDETPEIPLMVTSKDTYELYLFFFHEDKFYFHLVWTYDCSYVNDMAQLIFHLRNLQINKWKPKTISGRSTIARLKNIKQGLGKSLSSTKSTRKTLRDASKDDRQGHSSRQESASDGLTNHYSLVDYGILIPQYPNVRHGFQICDSLPVVIKFSSSSNEIKFLQLLNSKHLKNDVHNRTVTPLKIFVSHGPFFNGDSSEYQIVFPVLEVLSSDKVKSKLNPKLYTKLSQQLSDHCKFLHMQGICHRDIKPSNLALDEKYDLIVLDCDLMEHILSDPVVYTFTGTKEFANPDYYANPEIGFNVFELEEYSVQKTIKWMEMAAFGKQDSGVELM